MKAIVTTEYGPPESLQFREVDPPVPGDGEVLIKVHAASLNAYDWRLLRADPFLVRISGRGFFRPKLPIPGADIAGRIVAIGRNVTNFQIGDDVYGCLSECGDGGFAEYVCATEEAVVLKPRSVSFEDAASVPMAGLTALQGLRDTGSIQAGERVLVNGASGGVGTFAVQIARAFGGSVTGVCSTAKVELTRRIGASDVIDYTKEDYTRSGKTYDLILDVAANHSVSDTRRALSPGGRCAVVGFSTLTRLMEVALFGAGNVRKRRQPVRISSMKPNPEDLLFMNTLLESGKVKPLIDRRYPLHELPQAIAYLEQGHASGKVLIIMEEER